MKVNELKQLIENTLAKEVKKAILESTDEVYIIKNKDMTTTTTFIVITLLLIAYKTINIK